MRVLFYTAAATIASVTTAVLLEDTTQSFDTNFSQVHTFQDVKAAEIAKP